MIGIGKEKREIKRRLNFGLNEINWILWNLSKQKTSNVNSREMPREVNDYLRREREQSFSTNVAAVFPRPWFQNEESNYWVG